jgi:hypothetical protein
MVPPVVVAVVAAVGRQRQLSAVIALENVMVDGITTVSSSDMVLVSTSCRDD